MKLKDITFKKIIGHLKKGSSLEKKQLYSPRRDWITILLAFAFLLVTSVGVHYLLYILVDDGKVFNKNAEEEVFRAVLRRDALEEVVRTYSTKETNTNLFSDIQAVLTDPS